MPYTSEAASSSSTTNNTTNNDTLRIYCCGTNFNETNRGELIAELYHYDKSINGDDDNILVLSGAGRAHHSKRLTGLLDGYKDMEGNASKASEWIYDHLSRKVIDEGINDINILISGWSRGAITTFMISNEIDEVLEKIKVQAADKYGQAFADQLNVNVKVFAVDPVAGPTNGESRKLAQMVRSESREQNWNKMYNLGRCVTHAEVFYANDEQRVYMRPVFVSSQNSNTKICEMVLPGEHSSLVKAKKERYEDSINIVCKSAELFYKINGIDQDTSKVFEVANLNSAKKANAQGLNLRRNHQRKTWARKTSSFTIWKAFEQAHTSSDTECPIRNKGKSDIVTNMHVEKFRQFKQINKNSKESSERLEKRFNANTDAEPSQEASTSYQSSMG